MSCCGSEYSRRARCGKTARRDLCGGCQVTGSPTAINFVGPNARFRPTVARSALVRQVDSALRHEPARQVTKAETTNLEQMNGTTSIQRPEDHNLVTASPLSDSSLLRRRPLPHTSSQNMVQKVLPRRAPNQARTPPLLQCILSLYPVPRVSSL